MLGAPLPPDPPPPERIADHAPAPAADPAPLAAGRALPCAAFPEDLLGDQEDFYERESRGEIQRTIEAVLESEGPISETLLLRRAAAKALGFGRVPPRMHARMDEGTALLIDSGRVTTDGHKIVLPRGT